jgi:hypothetical protein
MRVTDEKCESCGRLKGEKHIATEKRPSIKTLEHWNFDGDVEATDGCIVEPDGYCEHGHASWMLVLGVI